MRCEFREMGDPEARNLINVLCSLTIDVFMVGAEKQAWDECPPGPTSNRREHIANQLRATAEESKMSALET